MARALRGLPRRALWLLLAHQLFLVTACQHAHYGALMQEQCLSSFQRDMEAIERTLWCDWDKTIGSYGALTDCTRNLAERLGCFWPNVEVDRFFVAVHRHYFRSCPITGRALGDPPQKVLCPFVVLPITATLLVTVLVVWRNKRPETIV